MIGLLLLVVAAALLVAGAELFVENAAGAAARLGITVLAVGILLAGAEPEELLTVVIAALQDRPGLAAGDAIGANVTMLTACLGLAALIRPLHVGRRVREYAALSAVAGALAVIALFDGHVSRVDGLLLVAAYVGLVALVWWREKEPPKLGELADVDDEIARLDPRGGQPARFIGTDRCPLGRLEQAGLLRGTVLRDVSRPGDQVQEAVERHVRHGLQDLLVVPTGLARLLVEVERRRSVVLQQRLDVAQQSGLPLVMRVELARECDLVESEPGLARGAGERGEGVLAALMLGNRECHALLGLERHGPVPQLGPEARIGAQRRRRPREHAKDVGKLPAACQGALQHRKAALGRSELVVDLEPALLGLHGRFTFCEELTDGKYRRQIEACPPLREIRMTDPLGSFAPASGRG